MTTVISGVVQLGLATPLETVPGHERTALLLANELGSPLKGPGGEPGDFSKHLRRVANASGIAAVGVERPGSADITYSRADAPWIHSGVLTRHAAESALEVISEELPDTNRIVGLAHSAGADYMLRLVRAMGEDKLPGHEMVSDVVVMDYPRGPNLPLLGVARFVLYNLLEDRWEAAPKLPEEQQPATQGASERSLADARYNVGRWSQGAQDDLTWIAEHMPRVAIHVILAKHSPNHMLRPRSTLARYAEQVNQLRANMAGAAACRAYVHEGPHADGSRSAVLAELLTKTGIVKPLTT